MENVTRRSFVKGAALGAVSVSTLGLAGCGESKDAETTKSEGTSADSNKQPLVPVMDPIDTESANNFNVVPDSATEVGTTLQNLKTAVEGETGATAKYEAFAEKASADGFDELARLFQCTSDAEKIHIELEAALIEQFEPDYKRPEYPEITPAESDINLISGANGEIYETSDMYPSFIAKANEEGEDEAVEVFTRAKLAEGFHAQRYLDAYNRIDQPSDVEYYLCPVCGYIHRGNGFEACPICLAPESSFTAY